MIRAVVRAARGLDPAPWEVVEASLCERFHCLPSQLDSEDVARILRGIDVLELYRDLRRYLDGERLKPSEMDRIMPALQAELEDYGG
jgi:hypothetical protein